MECMLWQPLKYKYIMNKTKKNQKWNKNCVLYGLNFDTPQKCEHTWIHIEKVVHEHIPIMMFQACQTLMYLTRILVLACTLNN